MFTGNISVDSTATFGHINTSCFRTIPSKDEFWPIVGSMLVQRRIGSMLVHRLRRWTNIEPTLAQRLVPAGYLLFSDTIPVVFGHYLLFSDTTCRVCDPGSLLYINPCDCDSWFYTVTTPRLLQVPGISSVVVVYLSTHKAIVCPLPPTGVYPGQDREVLPGHRPVWPPWRGVPRKDREVLANVKLRDRSVTPYKGASRKNTKGGGGYPITIVHLLQGCTQDND